MRRLALLLLGAIMLATALTPAASADTTPGYVSVMFGRMQWASTDQNCEAYPNTVDLGTVKAALDERGIDGAGIVITSRTPETGFRCTALTTTPGWDTLSAWHAEGWSFVSGGTHANMTTLDHAGQWQESCGSLPVFTEHGIDGSGMFAYGNNAYTEAIQADPVSTCFDFGRRYSGAINQRASMGFPWFADVHSVNGGMCNDPALPCSTQQHTSTRRYASPVEMAERVAASPDTWYAVQFYRFVQGSFSGSGEAWDCTSPDWTQHFTSRTEMYCFEDFLHVMDALAAATASGGVVVAGPGTVADAWGREVTPPGPDVTPPSVAITHPADGATVPKRSVLRITADASDDVQLAQVQILVGGKVICSREIGPFVCDWKVPAKPNALYTVTATARDAAGNTATATASIRAA